MEIGSQVEAINVADKEVVERVLGGEQKAFELIMRKYNQRLFRIVRAYIKNEDDIEDVMQESYVKAYEHLSQFENRSSFSTWLIRITINEALSRMNQGKRFNSVSHLLPDGQENSYSYPAELCTNDTPVGILMNTELKDILEEAVDRLPEKYRSVFVMREVEGMSVAETSESLSITESNVKVRLNRAKEMLRDTIGNFYHRSDVFHFDLHRCNRIVEKVLDRLNAWR